MLKRHLENTAARALLGLAGCWLGGFAPLGVGAILSREGIVVVTGVLGR